MSAIFGVFRNEFSRIFTLRPAFATLILATCLYAAFYPQPYVNEALRDLPIAIVDHDGTLGSQELARRVDMNRSHLQMLLKKHGLHSKDFRRAHAQANARKDDTEEDDEAEMH